MSPSFEIRLINEGGSRADSQKRAFHDYCASPQRLLITGESDVLTGSSTVDTRDVRDADAECSSRASERIRMRYARTLGNARRVKFMITF